MVVTPYYQDDLVILYHGDSIYDADLRHQWVGSHADFLITDPPYGMAYQSNKSKYKGPSAPIAGDGDTTLRDKALAYWAMYAPYRPALVFGTWKVARPDGVRQLLIWDKGDCPGMGDLSLPWGPSHEDIYVLGNGWKGKRGPSVIRSQTLGAADANRPNHPTPKPVGLMEALIAKVPDGDVIVDPFAGSGATLIAARNLGHPTIGIELEERYCEMIATRLAQGAFLL